MRNPLLACRNFASKWLMRTQNAAGLLSIPLRATTAGSVLTLAIQDTWLADYTALITAGFAAGLVAFIWGYDYFKVMNQQGKYNAERTDNYYGPTGAINQLAAAERNAVLAQAIKEDWGLEKTREEMKSAAERAVKQYKDGVDMERFEK